MFKHKIKPSHGKSIINPLPISLRDANRIFAKPKISTPTDIMVSTIHNPNQSNQPDPQSTDAGRGGVWQGNETPTDSQIHPPLPDDYASKKRYFLRDLHKKSKDELLSIASGKMAELMRRIKDDPKIFLFNFVWTKDEQDEKEPTKRMPDKTYLREVVDIWMRERLTLVEKSRQMMMTWLMVSLHLWYAMYFRGRHIFFVSKKEEDADILLERTKFVYDHLPPYLKVPMHRKYCYMRFDGMESIIHAVSQESDALRQHTASAIFSDEMAFQPYARKSYQGARPTLEGGGRFTGISTANGKNFFYNLKSDLE